MYSWFGSHRQGQLNHIFHLGTSLIYQYAQHTDLNYTTKLEDIFNHIPYQTQAETNRCLDTYAGCGNFLEELQQIQ